MGGGGGALFINRGGDGGGEGADYPSGILGGSPWLFLSPMGLSETKTQRKIMRHTFWRLLLFIKI